MVYSADSPRSLQIAHEVGGGWLGVPGGRVPQKFVIAEEGVFRDQEFGGHAQAPWGAQAVLIAQGGEVQITVAELVAKQPLHIRQDNPSPQDS